MPSAKRSNDDMIGVFSSSSRSQDPLTSFLAEDSPFRTGGYVANEFTQRACMSTPMQVLQVSMFLNFCLLFHLKYIQLSSSSCRLDSKVAVFELCSVLALFLVYVYVMVTKHYLLTYGHGIFHASKDEFKKFNEVHYKKHKQHDIWTGLVVNTMKMQSLMQAQHTADAQTKAASKSIVIANAHRLRRIEEDSNFSNKMMNRKGS